MKDKKVDTSIKSVIQSTFVFGFVVNLIFSILPVPSFLLEWSGDKNMLVLQQMLAYALGCCTCNIMELRKGA